MKIWCQVAPLTVIQSNSWLAESFWLCFKIGIKTTINFSKSMKQNRTWRIEMKKLPNTLLASANPDRRSEHLRKTMQLCCLHSSPLPSSARPVEHKNGFELHLPWIPLFSLQRCRFVAVSSVSLTQQDMFMKCTRVGKPHSFLFCTLVTLFPFCTKNAFLGMFQKEQKKRSYLALRSTFPAMALYNYTLALSTANLVVLFDLQFDCLLQLSRNGTSVWWRARAKMKTALELHYAKERFLSILQFLRSNVLELVKGHETIAELAL